MIKTSRKKAIYSRKSKYTGKGESTQNQIEVCKKKIENTFSDVDLENDILIYEDEGYTGANMNRPQFKQMMKDIEAKKIDTVVFYKLDRISRNVADFSNLVKEFDEFGVNFLSATENIENVSPAGRAMMFMISVFAQFERDIIAERIRDNMIELAKTGRWLGGKSPTGYKSEKVERISIDGKNKELYKLTIKDDEINIPNMIYNKFLELKSLNKLETYCLQNNIKTQTGKDFTRWSLKNILTNPVYAIADKDVYEYFNGVDIYANKIEFNGEYGLMVYNKTKKKISTGTVEKRDIEEWIIAIGKHKGIINGKDWVEVQRILRQNEDMRYRKPSASNALLSGILKCEFCGSYMRAKMQGKTTDEKGRRRFSYMCELKDRSRKVRCQCPNIDGLKADDMVMEEIKKIAMPSSALSKALKNMAAGKFNQKDEHFEERNSLKKLYEKNEKDSNALVDKIKYIDDTDVLEEITSEIKRLKEAKKQISEQLNKLSGNKYDVVDDTETASLVLSILETYFNAFYELDLNQKRDMIKLLVSTMTTNGEDITINFLGTRDAKSTAFFPTGENSKRNFNDFAL